MALLGELIQLGTRRPLNRSSDYLRNNFYFLAVSWCVYHDLSWGYVSIGLRRILHRSHVMRLTHPGGTIDGTANRRPQVASITVQASTGESNTCRELSAG